MGVRLKSVLIEDFKNVRRGEIALDDPKRSGEASILALYGQNGSGKTALINSIELLKYLLSGAALSPKMADCVNAHSEHARFEFRFSVQIEGAGCYDARYGVSISRQDLMGATLEHACAAPAGSGPRARVFDEVLSCSFSAAVDADAVDAAFADAAAAVASDAATSQPGQPRRSFRMRKLADSSAQQGFGPKSIFETVAPSEGARLDAAVAKRMASKECRSFLFSPELHELMLASADPILRELLFALAEYGSDSLFVLGSGAAGLIGIGTLPFSLRYDKDGDGDKDLSSVFVKLNEVNEIHAPLFPVLQEAVDSANLVLCQIVPGLRMRMHALGPCVLRDGREGLRLIVLSERDGVTLPFRCESDGVKKIVSVLQLLIAVYNNPDVTVAIDELDAGVFEYLLGELLRIIARGGRGQLIFSSHNLRPLETLDSCSIAFTSTNAFNRYIRPRKAKPGANLRDAYFRDIVLGESCEDVYERTSNSEIALAFSLAGACDEP